MKGQTDVDSSAAAEGTKQWSGRALNPATASSSGAVGFSVKLALSSETSSSATSSSTSLMTRQY